MPRILLTFATTHKLLAAEKRLKKLEDIRVRPTPTPAHLTESVCGMSLELLTTDKLEALLVVLAEHSLEPSGVHELAR